MAHAEFRVWWIPQVLMKPFTVGVPDIDTGVLLCDALARYDLFQYKHHIKPEFSHGGGISWAHPLATDGEWWDVDPDDELEMRSLRDDLAALQ